MSFIRVKAADGQLGNKKKLAVIVVVAMTATTIEQCARHTDASNGQHYSTRFHLEASSPANPICQPSSRQRDAPKRKSTTTPTSFLRPKGETRSGRRDRREQGNNKQRRE